MSKYTTDIWKNGGSGTYTKREDLYLMYADKISKSFKGGTVLEIGPGTGLFAKKMISEYNIKKYIILDLEKNIKDSLSTLLNEDADIISCFASDYRNLFDMKFDLVVSNVCIPETPKEYREELLENVIAKTKSSLIIGQLDGDWVEGDEYKTWILDLFNKEFDDVKLELTDYKNCYALSGEKNDKTK